VPYNVTRVLLGTVDGLRYLNFHTTVNRFGSGVPAGPVVDWIGGKVIKAMRQLWQEESGQDVAEYAVMLAVILVIVIGTVRLIGGNANNVFSQVGSQMAQ
jgi:Flp pilus assembly pilin Flp